MSKCGLCGREMRDGETTFSSFGLLPSTTKVCSGCMEELKSLYFGASKMDENEYHAQCERIKAQYSNAAADAAIASANGMRYSSTASGESSVGDLYSNPGNSMITLAKTIFFVIAAISFVLAIVLAGITGDFNFIMFLVTILVGVLVAYLTGLFLAAFGHLVSDVKFIRSMLSTRK